MFSFVQLQKSLTNSENERRVMAERLESVQQALQELRRAQQQLTDTHARTCQELSNCEVQRAGLESQLRLANWPSESGTSDEVTRLQKERSDMRIKLEAMHDKVSFNLLRELFFCTLLCYCIHQ